MYFVYLTNILKIYYLIRFTHGVYVSYYFLRWILSYTYSSFLWAFSFLKSPNQQITDKYFQTKNIDDDYILII